MRRPLGMTKRRTKDDSNRIPIRGALMGKLAELGVPMTTRTSPGRFFSKSFAARRASFSIVAASESVTDQPRMIGEIHRQRHVDGAEVSRGYGPADGRRGARSHAARR